MTEIITKIAGLYPQIASYILISFLAGSAFYKVFRYFSQLEHKIDMLAERMATKEDLLNVKLELKADISSLQSKVIVIEEKVEVLWKKLIIGESSQRYDFPIVSDGNRKQ